MKAIILIAGLGTRLRPLTELVPKCMIKVGDRTILDNALEALEAVGVTETTLVVGYKGKQIQARTGDRLREMAIRYVENPAFMDTNTSYSAWLGLEKLPPRTGLLLLEGDVFFENRLLHDLLEKEDQNTTIVERHNPNLDGSFVALDETGRVTDWIHKSRRPPGFTIRDKFKTVNIHRFDGDFIENYFRPHLQKSLQKYKGTVPLELVMEDMLREDSPCIQSFHADGYKWFEIDNEEELEIAKKIFGFA